MQLIKFIYENSMKKIILLLSVLLLSQNSNSAHIGAVSFKQVRVWDSYVLIRTNEPMTTPPECAERNDFIYIPLNVDLGHAANRKLSVILAAQAQNKVFNPNCSTICFDSGWLGKITQCSGDVSITN